MHYVAGPATTDRTRAAVWRRRCTGSSCIWEAYIWERDGSAYWMKRTFGTQEEAFTAAFKKVKKIRRKRG